MLPSNGKLKRAGALRGPQVPAAVLRLVTGLLVSAAALSGTPVLHGSSGTAFGQTPDREAAPRQVPGAFEITAHYRALVDSARDAENEILALAETAAEAAEVSDVRQRERELTDAFLAVTSAEYARPDRFLRLRDLAVMQEQRLDELFQRLSGRLERLGRLREEWLEREALWLRWDEALEADPQYALVEPEIGRALARIRSVLDQAERAVPAVLALQREVEEVRSGVRQVIQGVAAVRERRREALLRRDEPMLLSPAFFNQLDRQMWAVWEPGVVFREAAIGTFLRQNAGVLALHVLVALIVMGAAQRLRRRVYAEGTWSSMLRYPRATGIFASTAVFVHRYAFAPPVWDVLMWALLSGSIALLTVRLVPSRPLRILVYFFAGFYPLFLLAEAVQMPAPLFRLVLATVAAAGVILFGFLIGRQRREPEGGGVVRWTLGAAALVWVVVLFLEVLGYYLLARWMLHATLLSALIIFVVGFLVAFARGAIRTLLRLEAKGRLRFLRNVAIPLAERLVLLLQAALVVGAFLTLLDVWELVASPVEAWRSIIAVGFTVAGIEITLERVLVAALVIYLAFLGSWLVRTFIQSEMTPRWNMDPSVSNSIILLVHYTLIVLGILFGLAVLGVGLQNFAIIAGALGIGIGFGLQNIVNNFVSGLILLFERPIRVGDTVVIDGEWGTVKKIGLRSTIVVTFDRSEIIVPNADLISEKVTNWTLSDPVARLILPVGVAYGSDIRTVMEVLRSAARAHPVVLEDPEPMPLFIGFGDSSLDFELRVWVREIHFRLEVMSTVLADVERRLRDAGIEIPFPQRDLHLRSIDPALSEAWSPRRPSAEAEETPDSSAQPDGR